MAATGLPGVGGGRAQGGTPTGALSMRAGGKASPTHLVGAANGRDGATGHGRWSRPRGRSYRCVVDARRGQGIAHPSCRSGQWPRQGYRAWVVVAPKGALLQVLLQTARFGRLPIYFVVIGVSHDRNTHRQRLK